MLTNLVRPLIFMDLETTTNVVRDARICQFHFKKYFPDAEVHEMSGYVNPVIAISEAATKVHGLTSEMLRDYPTLADIGADMHQFILGCDIVGYNSNAFDLPVLYNEFQRIGIDWDYSDANFIDACNIFKINEPRDLQHAYKHYTGKTLVSAHNAGKDVDATVEVFVHQMEKYGLSWDMEQLALYSNYGQKRADLTGKFFVDVEGSYVINFGKYKGVKAAEQMSYLAWMLTQDFPPDAKRICGRILNREFV